MNDDNVRGVGTMWLHMRLANLIKMMRELPQMHLPSVTRHARPQPQCFFHVSEHCIILYLSPSGLSERRSIILCMPSCPIFLQCKWCNGELITHLCPSAGRNNPPSFHYTQVMTSPTFSLPTNLHWMSCASLPRKYHLLSLSPLWHNWWFAALLPVRRHLLSKLHHSHLHVIAAAACCESIVVFYVECGHRMPWCVFSSCRHARCCRYVASAASAHP